jgi:hypothetical protein
MFSRALDEVQLVERELHDRGFVEGGLLQAGRSSNNPYNWARTTLEPPIDSPNAGQFESAADWIVDQAAMTQLHFLAWAATDYQREHHKLPAALSELVPTYFAALPIDPWTGRNFLYEPKGVPDRLRATGGEIEKNQPFVASAGRLDCRIVVNPRWDPDFEPVRVFAGTNRDVNANAPRSAPSFPAPAVAIPFAGGSQRFRREVPAQPGKNHPTAPGAKPATKSLDKSLAKPAGEPPGAKVPAKK